MDIRIPLVIATVLMLANTAVLTLLLRSLPDGLRPSVRSWLAGTLLFSGSALLFGFQAALPLPLSAPLANGMLLLGLGTYWQALRQFYGLPARRLVFLPAALATLGVFWFAGFYPHTGIRIMIVSVAWVVLLGGSIMTLHAQKQRDGSTSHLALSGIFLIVFIFIVLRALYFLLVSVSPDFNVVNDIHWMNSLTSMMVMALPIIGTTAFLLLSFDRVQRQWELAASTDFLTGLANRRTLTTRGRERLARHGAHSNLFALAVIDIDNFKLVNDSFGHEIGDLALCHVATVLKENIRGLELVARLGGEEFVVLLDPADHAQARAAGERLRRAVESRPFTHGLLRLPITVSIGIAVYSGDDGTFERLLHRADQALYVAKESGRNRLIIDNGESDPDSPQIALPGVLSRSLA